MGSCLSCLGVRRTDSGLEENETSRLLYDDPYRSQYGTRGPPKPAYQPDPESVRREREALDGICHSMSDNVIDVFTIQAQCSKQGAAAASQTEHLQSPAIIANNSQSSEDVGLRTIKKGRGGPIFSSLKKGSSGIKAVQDAIG